jgi:nucleotide-binding universal stress UspA family protein
MKSKMSQIKRRSKKIMFKRILIPLDGSWRAERALPIAARMARASHGSIILLCVVNHFVLDESTPTHKDAAYSEDEGSVVDAEVYLQAVADSPALASLPVETAVLSGPVASTLLLAAKSYAADIIILCSHGHTGVTNRLLGHVAERIICRSFVPVLLLRENSPVSLSREADSSRPFCVLVTTDGTALTNRALIPAAELAVTLASPENGVLHLARVVSPGAMRHGKYSFSPNVPNIKQVQNSLAALATYLYGGMITPLVAQHRLAVIWSAVEHENVADALVALAEQGNCTTDAFGGCDVITLAIYGWDDCHRLTQGSVVADVLAATSRPILFVYPLAQAIAHHALDYQVTA